MAITSDIRACIEAAAATHGLAPNLVEAVVLTESGGIPWAWRPEPRYRYLMDVRTGRPFRALTPAEQASETPPADFKALSGDAAQEWWAQQASWGLMQVMGAVAREHGFRAQYLTELLDPMTGLRFGCKHLAWQLNWAKDRVDLALGAYNAGRGNATGPDAERYVVKVRGYLAEIEGSTRRA